jgi:hypothetical protein
MKHKLALKLLSAWQTPQHTTNRQVRVSIYEDVAMPGLRILVE